MREKTNMKVTKIFLLILGLGLGACNKAPKYAPGGGTRGAKPGQSGNGNPDNPPIDTIEVSDKYLGLTCRSDDPKGFRAWRRLSNTEFKNTLIDVFGEAVAGEVTGLPSDISKHEVYDTMMVPVNFIDVQKLRSYREIAKKVANKVDLAMVFPCLKEGEACMTKTLPELGARAWRRPLNADEVAKLAAIFKATVADGISAEDSAKLIIQGLIISNNFLYRTELGEKGANGVYTLTGWEIASALSYTILRYPPDEALRKLAASGGLSTPEAIKTQALRLFADPRSQAAWKDFANMWLDSKAVVEAEKTAQEFDQSIRERSRDEVGNLFSSILNKAGASTLDALLTADAVPAGAGANVIYDAMPMNGQIQFKEEERRGVLGQTSFLASRSNVEETSPVKRGAFIIERLLCTGFVPVPVFELPKKKEGQSNRDRYLDIAKIPACGSCHNPINSFGFAFENFDHLGRYRSEADGEEIKAQSEVTIDGEKMTINSPAELSAAIAKSKQGRECFVRHVFRFGLGRLEYAPLPIIGETEKKTVSITAQGDADSCQIKSIAAAMDEANGDMKTPIIKLLTSPGFLQRVDRKSELKNE